MQVVLHAGVHCTDDDRLLKCLLRNTDTLRDAGSSVPGPSRYRSLLSDIMQSLADSTPTPEARDVVLEAVLDDDVENVDRLIMSHPDFFGRVTWCLANQEYYTKAAGHLANFCRIFDRDEVELFLAIRDPATFLPAAFQASRTDDFSKFMRDVDPRALSWADLVARIKHHNPNLSITVWCNEDTPLIWGQLLRDIGALNPGQKIRGAFDLLSEIMDPEGMKRFRAYLAQHDLTEMQRRRVMVAFLDKYALDDEIEEELDLPGWDDELVATLSEGYDDDLYEISRIPGVTVIEP